MSRLPLAKADSFAGSEREAFDKVAGRTGFYRPEMIAAFEPYYGRLLNDPVLSEHHHDMSLYLKDAVPAYEKSFVLITTNIEWKCFFNLRPQIPNAVADGMRVEAIEAMLNGRYFDLTEAERLLVDFIRQVMYRTTNDEIVETMQQRLGARTTLDLAFFIAWNCCVLQTISFLGVEEPPDEEIFALLDQLRGLTAEELLATRGDPHGYAWPARGRAAAS